MNQKTEPEKPIWAKTRSEVLADVQRLEKAGETGELGGYLIKLAKLGENLQQYETLFRGYLYSPETYLREAAVFSLLYGLGLQKDEYRACALEQLALVNEEGDVEARRWAAFSLAHAYRGQKDKALLRIFFAILDDASEDSSLKESSVSDILALWGLSGREQAFRINSGASLGALLREFEAELVAARGVSEQGSE